MMLHVLLATVLSGSPAIPADSVRNAAKTATTRPDTTLLTLPGTAITPAKQVPPPPVSPVAPVGSTVASGQGSSATAPASAAAPSTSPTTASSWSTTVKSTTIVTSTAPAATQPAIVPVAQASARAGNFVATKPSTPTADSASPKAVPVTPAATSAKPASTTADSAAPKSAPPTLATARPQHEVVQQAATSTATAVPTGTSVASASTIVSSPATARAEPAPVPAIPAAAPADASAVVAPRAVTSTRVDARTVVSVKSSERIEPLYSVPLPTSRVRAGAPSIADSIVVYKRERTLTLYYRGVPVRSYFVALGSKPLGDKERAGDQRTPEGLFHINAHNPASKFHLALRISYPDDAHRARAAALGADPGGDIMIHGLPKEYSEAGKDHIANDWTNGCVALSNPEIEEIWRAVPDGTPVQIKP
jgi:hypothetical protein